MDQDWSPYLFTFYPQGLLWKYSIAEKAKGIVNDFRFANSWWHNYIKYAIALFGTLVLTHLLCFSSSLCNISLFKQRSTSLMRTSSVAQLACENIIMRNRSFINGGRVCDRWEIFLFSLSSLWPGLGWIQWRNIAKGRELPGHSSHSQHLFPQPLRLPHLWTTIHSLVKIVNYHWASN